eukprot:14089397-Alexandrium_andersonii.AAC.1
MADCAALLVLVRIVDCTFGTLRCKDPSGKAQLRLRITPSLPGEPRIGPNLQPGVAASENRDRRRGPKGADCLQESTA